MNSAARIIERSIAVWETARVGEHPPLDFQAPREHVSIDVAALMAAVPQGTTTKRIFVDIAAALVDERVSLPELLARAQVDSLAEGPFDDVLWHDYFRVLLVIAAELCGPEQLGDGLRQIGRSFYVGIAETVVGRMLLGRQLGDAVRKAAETWETLATIGSVRVEQLSERHYRYRYDRYPTELAETMVVGIFEGMFRHFHMPVELRLARLGPRQAVLDMCW